MKPNKDGALSFRLTLWDQVVLIIVTTRGLDCSWPQIALSSSVCCLDHFLHCILAAPFHVLLAQRRFHVQVELSCRLQS